VGFLCKRGERENSSTIAKGSLDWYREKGMIARRPMEVHYCGRGEVISKKTTTEKQDALHTEKIYISVGRLEKKEVPSGKKIQAPLKECKRRISCLTNSIPKVLGRYRWGSTYGFGRFGRRGYFKKAGSEKKVQNL